MSRILVKGTSHAEIVYDWRGVGGVVLVALLNKSLFGWYKSRLD
jgi:hypothetical protein